MAVLPITDSSRSIFCDIDLNSSTVMVSVSLLLFLGRTWSISPEQVRSQRYILVGVQYLIKACAFAMSFLMCRGSHGFGTHSSVMCRNMFSSKWRMRLDAPHRVCLESSKGNMSLSLVYHFSFFGNTMSSVSFSKSIYISHALSRDRISDDTTRPNYKKCCIFMWIRLNPQQKLNFSYSISIFASS